MSAEPAILDIDLFGDPVRQDKRGPLSERFLMPPFSVLSARDGAWQERKRAWLSIGLAGELGRGDGDSVALGLNGKGLCDTIAPRIGRGISLLDNGNERKPENQERLSEAYGRDLTIDGSAGVFTAATSIFDPVLCELMYRWFCPVGGTILDPFAGGSVRGIVAAYMGRQYWGCDLRPEQITANESQADALCNGTRPTWVCGDSREKLNEAPDEVDFVFSCPPYGDLEVYSEMPNDISNMEWPKFCEALSDIIAKSVARLKPNRFACFVVGDFRDPKTHSYRGFPWVTTVFFLKAGLKLHNEAILVTSVGSLPVRVAKGFEVSRKLGKTHQNILVFVKGDPRKAAAACESVPVF